MQTQGLNSWQKLLYQLIQEQDGDSNIAEFLNAVLNRCETPQDREAIKELAAQLELQGFVKLIFGGKDYFWANVTNAGIVYMEQLLKELDELARRQAEMEQEEEPQEDTSEEELTEGATEELEPEETTEEPEEAFQPDNPLELVTHLIQTQPEEDISDAMKRREEENNRWEEKRNKILAEQVAQSLLQQNTPTEQVQQTEEPQQEEEENKQSGASDQVAVSEEKQTAEDSVETEQDTQEKTTPETEEPTEENSENKLRVIAGGEETQQAAQQETNEQITADDKAEDDAQEKAVPQENTQPDENTTLAENESEEPAKEEIEEQEAGQEVLREKVAAENNTAEPKEKPADDIEEEFKQDIETKQSTSPPAQEQADGQGGTESKHSPQAQVTNQGSETAQQTTMIPQENGEQEENLVADAESKKADMEEEKQKQRENLENENMINPQGEAGATEQAGDLGAQNPVDDRQADDIAKAQAQQQRQLHNNMMQQQLQNQSRRVPKGSLPPAAPHRPVILSDIIENSIRNIGQLIAERGGDDRQALFGLLHELRNTLLQMQATRQIPQKYEFMKAISGYFEKYEWFYYQAISLLGEQILLLLFE